MPAGPRIRSNSEFGLITDNPLTAGATTFNSARLSLMPVVAAAHAVVTLDPRAVNGEPEIVIMTAHSAAATVATITRGAYGTVARSHPVGTEWIHAPIDEDFIEVLTSSTRPSDPYRGQPIWESDTNKLVFRTQDDVWMDGIGFGEWDTWVPTLAAGWAVGGGGSTIARFTRIGRTIHFLLILTFGAGATFSASPLTFSLPAQITPGNLANLIGIANYVDADGGTYTGISAYTSSTSAIAYRHNVSGVNIIRNTVTSTTPHTWAASDRASFRGTYETVA